MLAEPAHRAPLWSTLLYAAGLLALWIGAIRAISTFDDQDYIAVGSSKTAWVVAAVVLGPIVWLIWSRTVRKRLTGLPSRPRNHRPS